LKVALVDIMEDLQSDIASASTVYMFGALKPQDRIGVLILNVPMEQKAVNFSPMMRIIPG
jgi:hypothetical protein